MRASWSSAITALLVAFALAMVAMPAYAYPAMGWDPTNHNWFQLTDGSGNITSPTGVILPDTTQVNCPAAPVATNIATVQCWTAPNDGHTYRIVGYNTRLTANAAGTTCVTSVEVANPGVAAGNGAGLMTPVACSTAAAVNTNQQAVLVAATAVPTIGVGVSVNLVVTGTATATTGLSGTVSIQRVS